jgi:hypothetical protein
MYSGSQPIIVMQQDCDSAYRNVTTALKSGGYSILRSFDLHSAMKDAASSACSPDSCACQMVVVLVYAQEGPPATLIFDSNQSNTQVYLASDSSQSAHSGWVGSLIQLLLSIFSPVNSVPSCAEQKK